MSRKNFLCPKCNKKYFYKELAKKKIGGAVPMIWLVCSECGEMVEEQTKDFKRKNA
jgi:transcription initiation factor IIE alpha subunit